VHNSTVQAICVTNYEKFIISGDKKGNIAYCDSKINRHNNIKAHLDVAVRDLSFSPASLKFMSCSDDRTARIFDFLTAKQEFEYNGHGSDVKTCDWHPSTCLVATGAQDNYVKLWDPRSGADV
jgi:polyadenylation factor subunit 2